VSYQRR